MKKNKKYIIPYRDKAGKLVMIPGINNFGDMGSFLPGSRVHQFDLSVKKIQGYYKEQADKYALKVECCDFINIKFSEN